MIKKNLGRTFIFLILGIIFFLLSFNIIIAFVPPTVTLSANPTTIPSGGSTTLTWSSTNADFCVGTGFSTGNATAGDVVVFPTASTTYSIVCTGPGGSASSSMAPGIISPTAANITSTSATLGAYITSDGGSSITAHGICLGTSPVPLGCQNDGAFTTGTFTQNRTSLTPDTLYYYRGYATNSLGTSYTSDATFRTTTTTFTGKPDLTGDFSPSVAVINTVTNLSVDIHNIGDSSTGSGNITHLFRLDNDANHTSGVINSTITSSGVLAAGETVRVYKPYTFTTTDPVYISVCADNDTSWHGTVDESNEGNNCDSWTTLTPVVSAPSVIDLGAGSPTPTTAVLNVPTTFSSNIYNSGNSPTENITITHLFRWDNDANHNSGVTYSTATSSGVIAAGEGVRVYKSHTFNTSGIMYLSACADNNTSWHDTVDESREDNNCSSWREIMVAIVPTVSLPTTGNISSTSATLSADITSDGNGDITAHGICLGVTPLPLGCQNDGAFTTGTFSQTRTGLTPETLYYYRGFATNNAGTFYTPDSSFTTTTTAASSATDITVNIQMSGILNTDSPCTISLGNNTCPVNFTWQVLNPINVNGSAITSPSFPGNVFTGDTSGAITKVEFYQNNIKLGEDTISPYTFIWNNVPAGTYSLTTKATDDDGMQTTSGGINVKISDPVLPQSIFTTQIPVNCGGCGSDYGIQYELATKFKTTIDGTITKARIYAPESDAGNHIVRLWRASDQALLSGPHDWNFSSGTIRWKEYTLPTPISVTAGIDYVISVTNSTTQADKRYAYTAGGFSAPINNQNLVTYVGSGSSSSNIGSFPSYVYNNANYFRDVVFVPNVVITPPSSTQTILTTQVPGFFGGDLPYELGTKFKTNTDGTVTKVRIYTSATESGNHTVRLWRVNDNAVLSGPHTWNITAGTAGWKEYTLPSAVAIQSGVDYIVSVSNSTDKIFGDTYYGFNAPIVNDNLITYVGSGTYSTTLGTMPTQIYNNSNYFRDVVFEPDVNVSSPLPDAPVTSITSPNNNSLFTTPVDITINADARDTGGSSILNVPQGVSNYFLYNDGDPYLATTTVTADCEAGSSWNSVQNKCTLFPPTVTISATPASISYNETSTITWSSTNAMTCTASGAWSGAKATEGTETTKKLTLSKTYILRCDGLGGYTISSATVSVGAKKPKFKED